MKTSAWLLRLVVFIVIAPVTAIVMAFIFVSPGTIDWWFSGKRRQEAIDVWRKLWSWVEGV